MSGSAYPFFTQVATPTSRSPQMQARIEDLASKIFTPYQLQKLRTFIPDIKFTVEEAKLYEYNIIDTDDDFKKLLRQFVGCAYVYDILANVMRDINERVANATREGVLDTSRKELGKIVNSLRGFVALAKDDREYNIIKGGKWSREGSSGAPLQGEDINYAVYMNRIPINVLEQIVNKKLSPTPSSFHTTSGTGIQVLGPGLQAYGQPKWIEVYKLGPKFLPQYNLRYSDPNEASTDTMISKLIPALSRDDIDMRDFAEKHIDRFVDLKLTKKYPPRAVLPIAFKNVIRDFIKRDLLAFNRMRSAILNKIDSWWRNHGALAMVDGGSKDTPWKAMADMMNADYRVSGLPQPSCGPGYGSLFFNKDPSDADAKIVDPYIVAADGSLVENPNAKFGPYCQRNKGGSDILSGVANSMSSSGGRLPNFHVANAARKKRKPRAPRRKRNAFAGLR
eukprot:jgi/Mesvir1/14621/Mv05291-RA.1